MKIESSRVMKMSARDRDKDLLILKRPAGVVSKDEETFRSDIPRPRAWRRLLRRLLSMRAKAPHSRDHRVIDLMGTGDVRV